MMIYCSHIYENSEENFKKATKKIAELQKNDTENTYISPLHAFSFLKYGELGYDKELLLCEDLLMMCDELWVLSEPSNGVNREIKLANIINIPIKYLTNC